MADPDHCSQYWECYNGCLTHMICQGNYLFDDVHGWCNIPESVCCGDRDCDGKHCKPDEECEPVDFDCPADGDFEDPHLCSTYYKCSGGIATRMCCQQGRFTNLVITLKITRAQSLKITQNVAFYFWHFPQIFDLLKLTCLVTLFNRKLQIFKN